MIEVPEPRSRIAHTLARSSCSSKTTNRIPSRHAFFNAWRSITVARSIALHHPKRGRTSCHTMTSDERWIEIVHRIPVVPEPLHSSSALLQRGAGNRAQKITPPGAGAAATSDSCRVGRITGRRQPGLPRREGADRKKRRNFRGMHVAMLQAWSVELLQAIPKERREA
ncbi:hypothetical protein KEG38_19580 [Polyangium jinanense]|uniref:hypothetical protein n=1 Tax=Polyangium jinanense TaxID=2829994 RepID=UPI002340B490|nr:hypothetical protein [Polyangium jinanense]MDC3956073.1 hypothetical protein [Polyangium jinanense]